MNYNRVWDVTTTTGTGTVTCAGTPPDGYLAVSTVPTGSAAEYTISGASGTEFEVGRGIVAGSTVSRLQVLRSSNSNALVNFSAGNKNVFITLAAESIQTIGKNLALDQGYGAF